MKYIPILFLAISIGFGVHFFLSENLKPLMKGRVIEEVNLDKGDYVLQEQRLAVEKGFMELRNKASLSFGESPASDEMALAIFERQQAKFRKELDVLRLKTDVLLNELQEDKRKREDVVTPDNSNTSLIIAFLSLLVSTLGMLPSWIQLVRGKSN
ncbi:hypothetical protein GCM10011369_18720 [Neiella marina]|uniref:Uncharacterized protein n=1 Tax=Neiella marina TaxID=508461 RepID=A0A8J2U4W8_9GAMM|nr:hypothetical protein [Neiella marina]GGA77076.1 hypothetical protein GCM10011369_18720 [Neiella marina]